MNKYQLIMPYHSSITHNATNLNKGSKKCYKELKKSGHQINKFSIMDLDNYKVYNFTKNQHGGSVKNIDTNIKREDTKQYSDDTKNIKINDGKSIILDSQGNITDKISNKPTNINLDIQLNRIETKLDKLIESKNDHIYKKKLETITNT